MESDQGKGYQSGNEQADRQAGERELGELQESIEVVPGAPVVRDNTPRPLSDEEPQEFIWLFEYGPEMDSSVLNSAERLDGAAYLYGPAVLKGYTLMFAEVVRSSTRRLLATIVPSADPDAEAWGVLYRIPRHVTVRNGSQPSLLDAAHSAGSPDSLFRPISVGVREMYREREITCGAYALTENARRQFPLLSLAQVDHSLSLVQQLAALARKQKFPDHYLQLSPPATSTVTQPSYQASASRLVEQNTEPIPAFKEGDATSTAIASARKLSSPSASRLLNALAIYLILLLLLVLTFAVLQGMGFANLPPGLLVLGVPWLVLVYGLLGACMSSLVSLGRSRQVQRPPLLLSSGSPVPIWASCWPRWPICSSIAACSSLRRSPRGIRRCCRC